MPGQVDFNTILEGLQSALTTVQHLCENQHQDEMEWFFNADGTPKVKRIVLPDMGDPKKQVTIDVPLFALVPHGSVRIKEMKVKFKTRLAAVIEGKEEGEGRECRTRLGTSIGGGSGHWWPWGGKKEQHDDVAEVEVVFSATEPPEGLVKVNDQILKRMP